MLIFMYFCKNIVVRVFYPLTTIVLKISIYVLFVIKSLILTFQMLILRKGGFYNKLFVYILCTINNYIKIQCTHF